MNLINETKKKLEWSKNYLNDLETCLDDSKTTHLTKDARHYIDDEITKSKKNVEYYEGVLRVLKGEK